MGHFDDASVNLDVLRRRAYNYRWAEVPEGVIPLTSADPDFPVAPQIRDAMAAYVQDGYFPYVPPLGLPEFRQAFSRAAYERKGEKIDPSLVLPLDSAASAMRVVARSFLRPGDQMIVFDPCDFLFRAACESAGATPVPVPVPMDPATRRMDLSAIESAITPRTRMLGLCNPHNPYGLVYAPEDLEQIMSICERHDLLILNDEIWSDIVYPDARFTSVYSLGNRRCDRVVSVFGFSKSFGLAGLRIGCAYTTSPTLFSSVVDHSGVQSTMGGAASISQVAATAALSEAYGWVDDFLRHLVRNRDRAVDAIDAIPGLRAYRPQATYLLYVDVSGTGLGGEELCRRLLRDAGLALIPGGRRFVGDASEGHVRVCFATSRQILDEGLERLRRGVASLG